MGKAYVCNGFLAAAFAMWRSAWRAGTECLLVARRVERLCRRSGVSWRLTVRDCINVDRGEGAHRQ